MPKFFCDYCGVYLTHSSPLGRKQHAKGRKHIQNKVEYYQQLIVEQNRQRQLDQKLAPFSQQQGNLNQRAIQLPLAFPKQMFPNQQMITGLQQGGIQFQPQPMVEQHPNLMPIQQFSSLPIPMQNILQQQSVK